MEMIERVARAIAHDNGDDFDAIPKHKPDWINHRGQFSGRGRDINEPFQSDYMTMAEAAIQAMREPTNKMLEMSGQMDGFPDEDFQDRADEFHKAWWQAMIDAALSGKSGMGEG